MSSYTQFLLTLSFLVCAVYAEEWRYIGDDNLGNSSVTEETNPLSLKLTTLLDIKVNGKSEIFQTNLNGFTGSDNVKRFEGNPNVDGKSYSDLVNFRREVNDKLADVAVALRKINAEMAKIKLYNYNIENNIDKENIGFKTRVGVQYERSSIKIANNISGMTYPKSCKEVLDKGNNVSGLYEIQPKMSKKPIVVLCEMDIKGGGWTHVQKRNDGSQDFFLGWRDYKFGFGDLNGEFWSGLENMYKMTVQDGTELLVEVEDGEGARAYAHYTSFKIGSEREGYPLSILNGYSGDAGDALKYHLGMKFTTKDFDQDQHPQNNAVMYSGAWWYKAGHHSNLNGKYMNLNLPGGYTFQGLHWLGFKPHVYSYAKSRMLIRSTV